MANIKRKQIAFNIDDPLQKELYEHIEQFKNFSYYGKSLIQRDMQGWQGSPKEQIESIELDVSIIEGFI